MKLAEARVSWCPKCKAKRSGRRCSVCSSGVSKTLVYRRVRVERLALTGIVSFLFAVAAGLGQGSFQAFAWALVLAPAFVLGCYWGCQYLFGFGGGLFDYYDPDSRPPEDEVPFSWKRVLKELFVLLAAVAALAIVGLLRECFRSS